MLIYLLENFGWYAGITLVVGLAEWRWPAGAQPRLIHRLANFAVAGLAFAVLLPLSGLMGRLNGALAQHGLVGLVFGRWHGVGLAAVILSSLVYLFVFDCVQYGFHRLQHRYLWPTHRLHHDDEQVNATTSLRNAPLHHVLSYMLVSVPTVIICGENMLGSTAALVFFTGWGFINHANVRLKLGRLTPVFSAPQWHRLHHQVAAGADACNFAAFFPLIDVIFGTYRAPARDEFPATGVAGPAPGSPLRRFTLAVLSWPLPAARPARDTVSSSEPVLPGEGQFAPIP